MVWFARWRPKFRKVVACTMIISALASAGSEIQELKSYAQAKAANAAYSEILKLDHVRKKNEKAVIEARKLFIEAVDMKTYAEKLSQEGKIEESKMAYRELLKKYEQIVGILTRPDEQGNHIALAKNLIFRIKRELEENRYFDSKRPDIRALEEGIHNDWLKVDELTKSVSSDMQEVERKLGIID